MSPKAPLCTIWEFNPLAMEMETDEIAQIWMVDDLAAAGKPEELKKWYET